MTFKGMAIGTGIVMVGLILPNISKSDTFIGLSMLLTFIGVIYWFISFE